MAEWLGRRVVVVGLARQGLALARYLASKGGHLVLNDRRPAEEMQPALDSLADLSGGNGGSVEWVFGGHPLGLLKDADLLCLSGGVPLTIPLVAEAQAMGIPLSNDSQIFLESVPCPVIGITGSAGKTTTTTLVGRMAQSGRRSGRVWVGGNIGSPLIANLGEMQAGDLAVMELSSFQLEIMARAPQVAALLNLTPNHLDRHATMEDYVAAKARILEFQSSGDAAVLGRDDPGAWGLVDRVRGARFSFGLTHLPEGEAGTFLRGESIMLHDGQSEISVMPTSSIRLRGEHNMMNVLAACAISSAAGLSVEAMEAGVQDFMGVPHRLEFVRSWKGADWYNDSIATAPERAMAAIRSFQEPLVLLAGGRDKNLPWEDFAHLIRKRVDYLILFGEAAQVISRAVASAGSVHAGQRPAIITCRGLREAVCTAAEIIEPGHVVLLSPGGTSFDEFQDFEERGEAYKRWVMDLQ